METDLHRANARIKELEYELQSAVEGATAAKRTSDAVVAKHVAQLTNVQERLDRAKTENERLQKDVADRYAEIRTIKTQSADELLQIRGKLSTLQARNEQLTSELSTYREMSEHGEVTVNVEAYLAAARNVNQELQGAMGGISAVEATKLAQQLCEQGAQLQKLHEVGNKLKEENAALRKRIAEMESEAIVATSKLENENLSLRNKIELEISSAHALRTKMEEQNAALQQQVSELSAVASSRAAAPSSSRITTPIPTGDETELSLQLQASDEALASERAHREILQDKVKSLNETIEKLSGDAAVSHDDKAKALVQAKETQLRLAEKEAQTLGERVAALENRLGRGVFDSRVTRVVHLNDKPPCASCIALKGELEAAKAQREEGGGDSANAAVAASNVQYEEEIKELKEISAVKQAKLDKAEKKYNRLTEQTRIALLEFKEVCKSLFGYSLSSHKSEVDDDNGVRGHMYEVRSVCAPAGTQKLLVQAQDGGKKIDLLDSPYLSSLATVTSLFFEVDTGAPPLPAFLAFMTLEHFRRLSPDLPLGHPARPYPAPSPSCAPPLQDQQQQQQRRVLAPLQPRG